MPPLAVFPVPRRVRVVAAAGHGAHPDSHELDGLRLESVLHQGAHEPNDRARVLGALPALAALHVVRLRIE